MNISLEDFIAATYTGSLLSELGWEKFMDRENHRVAHIEMNLIHFWLGKSFIN